MTAAASRRLDPRLAWYTGRTELAGYEQLPADQMRVLGPDHPDTLTTRHNLAHWREQAGPDADPSD